LKQVLFAKERPDLDVEWMNSHPTAPETNPILKPQVRERKRRKLRMNARQFIIQINMHLQISPFGVPPHIRLNLSQSNNSTSKPRRQKVLYYSFLFLNILCSQDRKCKYLCSGASSPSNLILNLIPTE